MGFQYLFKLLPVCLVSVCTAATLLYRTDFSLFQFTLETPDISGDSKGAWQHWAGLNAQTGVMEPATPFDADYSIFQMIIGRTVDQSTIGDYILNEIQQVPGPAGDTVYALLQDVKQIFPETYTQDAFMILRDQPVSEVGDVYYSFWFRFQPDLGSQLGNNDGYDNWRMMSEWKTGGSTDYRVATIVTKDIGSGRLFWNTTGQGWDEGGTNHDYWAVPDTLTAVPVGEWFKYEVFWSRGDIGGDNGRYWAAVNGRVIVDYQGSLYPDGVQNPEKINRIFLNNNYSGGATPAQQWTTGLEIWDGWPCGEGVSCHDTGGTAVEKAASPCNLLLLACPEGVRVRVAASGPYRVSAMDITGRKVAERKGSGPDGFTLSLPRAQGVYLVKASASSEIVIRKVVVIR